MVWKACSRFNILPPTIKRKWEDNGIQAKMMLIAFDQICSFEEAELLAATRGM